MMYDEALQQAANALLNNVQILQALRDESVKRERFVTTGVAQGQHYQTFRASLNCTIRCFQFTRTQIEHITKRLEGSSVSQHGVAICQC